MQCRRCGFENMPGVTVCMRCNATLVATEPVNVHPPRAGWTRIFRPIFYRLNRVLDWLPHISGRALGRWLDHCLLGCQCLIWATLSIVPGLGHLATGRFRVACQLVPCWLLALAAGLFLFGYHAGSVFLGLAIALHGWIICDAGRFRELFETGHGRWLFVSLVTLCIGWPGYHYLQLYLERNVAFVARAGENLTCDGLRKGDVLLFTPPARWTMELRRGDLLLCRMGLQRGGRIEQGGGDTLAKVLGLPGERVEVTQGIMHITDPVGHQTEYRLPSGIYCPDLSLSLPDDCCFCLPSRLIIRNSGEMGLNDHQIYVAMGRVPLSGIHGRAMMLYNPFWRRTRLPVGKMDPVKKSI